MKPVVHILNGDALFEQFPRQVAGSRIVARECLVEGPVSGQSLDAILSTRISFFAEAYQVKENEYREKSVREFKRIHGIPSGSKVYMWFEDDLFCQVNAWFVAAILDAIPHEVEVYWVAPEESSLELGFGGMDTPSLYQAFQRAVRLTPDELSILATMWPAYQHNDYAALLQLALALHHKLPMLPTAVAAHIERYPVDGSPGRPEKTLKSIMEELETEEFGPIFREFSKREAIYGFGDLQVRRLLDTISFNPQ